MYESLTFKLVLFANSICVFFIRFDRFRFKFYSFEKTNFAREKMYNLKVNAIDRMGVGQLK